MNYTCIESFTGAGGLRLGLERAGYKSILAFDNDPKSIETQCLNPQYFPTKPILADIREVLRKDPLDLAKISKGELFLLAGGPPCQGFSIQRIGPDRDERNDLVLHYISLVKALFPRFFLMENVPGISGARGRDIFAEMLRKASKAGYHIHQKTIDAQDFGVPQRRKRVIIVGERMDSVFPIFSFPEPTTHDSKRKTVRQTIGDLPAPPQDGNDYPGIPHHRRDKLSDLNKKRLKALKSGQGMEHLPNELLAECHKVGASIIGHRNVYGRMEWDNVAPTITARFDSFTRGQFGHPEQLRSISLREGALLQTFPLDFLFSGTKVDIARQIGNAVPPLLAESIGRQIIQCYENSLGIKK